MWAAKSSGDGVADVACIVSNADVGEFRAKLMALSTYVSRPTGCKSSSHMGYCPVHVQPADLFTKALSSARLEMLLKLWGVEKHQESVKARISVPKYQQRPWWRCYAAH